MNWEDEGYILSKKNLGKCYNFRSFTKNFGKVNGIVYGGTSRKVKNYLQLSQQNFVDLQFKNENKLGYFKTELVEAIAPKYFNNKKNYFCLNSFLQL